MVRDEWANRAGYKTIRGKKLVGVDAWPEEKKDDGPICLRLLRRDAVDVEVEVEDKLEARIKWKAWLQLRSRSRSSARAMQEDSGRK